MKKLTNSTRLGRSPLTLRERSIIEVRWCRDTRSITDIAKELERNKSSISREIDGKPRKGFGKYDAEREQAKACERIGKRGNTQKLDQNETLCRYVKEKLMLGWSPEQIAIRLPIEYTSDRRMRISYETIYQHVYRQVHRSGNGKVKLGKEDLRPYLTRRHTRRAKKGFRQAQRLGRPILPSIENRPKSVEKREEVGHWEDDTMVSRQSAVRLKTINERVSGIIFIGKMRDGSIAESNRVVIERLSTLPQEVRKTLTRDRGFENLGYREIEQELNMTCWFAHAYCSQERGSNENGNGLIRRPYPKKSDFAQVTDAAISNLEYQLNTRPRKRHCGLTPVEVFYQRTGVALYP